ncbi:MAG: hypothetical protein ACKVP7_05130 [Hyphomicrobiaceae bacterium]
MDFGERINVKIAAREATRTGPAASERVGGLDIEEMRMTKRGYPETLDISNWEEVLPNHAGFESYLKEARAWSASVDRTVYHPLPVDVALLYLRIIMSHPEFSWYCREITRANELTNEAYKHTSDVKEVWAFVDKHIPGFHRTHQRLADFGEWFSVKMRLSRPTMNSMLHGVAGWLLIHGSEPTEINLRRAFKQVWPHSDLESHIDFSR